MIELFLLYAQSGRLADVTFVDDDKLCLIIVLLCWNDFVLTIIIIREFFLAACQTKQQNYVLDSSGISEMNQRILMD